MVSEAIRGVDLVDVDVARCSLDSLRLAPRGRGQPASLTATTIHHWDLHQPPRDPCQAILGGVLECKLHGIIASKIYMHLEDVEIH